MTTHVGNNSVFRSFFEKQKLTGPNFIDWYRQLQIVLSVKGKENYLEHPIPAAPVAAPGQQLPPRALAAHEKGLSVSSYVLKMKSYIDNLERLDQPVSLCLATMNELHAMLKLHEQKLPKEDIAPALHAIRAGRIQKIQKKKPHKAAKGNQRKGKAKMGNELVPALSFAPKPKNPPTPKKDNPAKDAICHQCGEVGHWRRNCPVYLAELLKKKKLSQGASNSGALSLYVGNGHRAAVEAIGEFHLCLPNGLVLILYNCHYAPSITRGIILVLRLYDDGFVNHFDGNVLLVSRNNLIHFSDIPRDGIYEIDLYSSNTNDSFMYVVSNKRAKLNLDSTLLWHCRLGHISKKHIEKLQHDRLLNSTDIKSFEKCVSRMSEKMARKPYSHQVERAKDLLGLIHTDVYGPFRTVSRQGASYFITFTDDFSRYGYVYLLKHKHEFLDHQKEHEIISHQTPPYTPQHNALESAARILNMVPTNKVEKTPYEVWHGQAPKLSYLKVWGCETLVKGDTLTKPDKLEPISIKCIFVGYPKETMGYSFYYPPKNKVFVAQNADFFKNSLTTQEASGSLEDLEIIQEEDTQPSIDTSLHHKEDDKEIDEPQSDFNPIRRSTRTRRAPVQMCLHVDAMENELGC
ncbi:zinc finger, CCHC-type containing protein [Tanacetum coccineum]